MTHTKPTGTSPPSTATGIAVPWHSPMVRRSTARSYVRPHRLHGSDPEINAAHVAMSRCSMSRIVGEPITRSLSFKGCGDDTKQFCLVAAIVGAHRFDPAQRV